MVRWYGIFKVALLLLLAILWCVLQEDVSGGMDIGQCSVEFLAAVLELAVLGRERDAGGRSD